MKVVHWRYDDGVRMAPSFDVVDESDIGWYCWVYTEDHEHQPFLDWLQLHVRKGYEAIRRFNSGDPMTTLQINDVDEGLRFKKYWGDHFATY
jgi:hypothetical protein